MAVLYINSKKEKAFLWDYLKGLKKELSISECNEIKKLLTSDTNEYRYCYENVFNEIIKEKENRKSIFTMFDSDEVFLSDIMLEKTEAEYIFVGFPYDLGASQYRGSKFGPSVLRYNSTSILENETLRRKGILVGDLGDLKGEVFKSNGKEFYYLINVIEYLLCSNKFPIILGGDHSISYATLMGMCESIEEFGIIHLDAHQDYSGISRNDWERDLNHANFLDFLVERKEIKSITQLGIRNNILSVSHAKINSFSVEETISNIDQIIDSLDKSIPYFITFDVDCLSTSIMQSTGTPLPGGFEFREISSVLIKIINNLKILGIDIVELNDNQKLDAMTVNQLLILILLENKRYKNEHRIY
ncbi:arginase family protein [Facklamia sp. DSM 111018]|uniref:Arginase family protein n=1 Tax=Facklamia lactis TaxID=2749967 RepID=A0ABS0LR41_9LACT|nr:arginase family protein [Facklamia lactis]MBG9985759.1 arginase family protein [Facklamia lactis]